MKSELLTLVLCCGGLLAAPLRAIDVGPFGPHGEGGSKNGQDFKIGPGGSVYEFDAFLQLSGYDLNGAAPGGSAALSRHALPAGLNYSFSSALSADKADLVLTYAFSNATGGVLNDLRFSVLLDAEIDQSLNTFFNEYGSVIGTPGNGPWDGTPDLWQIDEPGFLNGTLFRNLYQGLLSNSNAIPVTAPNDVALGLGFKLGRLKTGASTSVRVMISEAGHFSTNGFALVHRDLSPASTTTITLSGDAEVTEPLYTNSPQLQLAFVWRLDRPTGSLIGNLSVTNPPVSTQSFGQPFRLGLLSSTNLFYVTPEGTLESGLPYVDLTAGILPQLGSDGLLDPGEGVVVTNAVQVYTRDRSAPATTNFEFWASQMR